MDTIRKAIGRNIKKFCVIRNIKQKELAERLGVQPSAVSNWVNGTNSIDIEKLAELCKVLNVSLNDIYGISNTEQSAVFSRDAMLVAEKYDQASAEAKKHVRLILDIPNGESAHGSRGA